MESLATDAATVAHLLNKLLSRKVTGSFKILQHVRWRSWLRHSAASRKVAGSIPDGVTKIFHWHNYTALTMGLEPTQPLRKVNTKNISLGVKAAGV
jgi:hypothetical protein